MKRRALLGGTAATVTGIALTGCQRVMTTLDPRSSGTPVLDWPLTRERSKPAWILQRAAFGPSPTDFQRLTELGKEGWLKEQLAAHEGDQGETLGLRWHLRSADVFDPDNGYELRDRPPEDVLADLQRAAVLRLVYSKWQLRERLCEFWANHFNIYARKVYTAPTREFATGELLFLLGEDLTKVTRKEALGSFPAMVQQSMHSAAMLGYLDNQVSKKQAPNENYARELMELHTLGVEGGYTQQDVHEVARCLSGWTIEDRFLKPSGTVYFDANRHDDGQKHILGHRIAAGGGETDAIRVWEIVTQHPSTARFIARKLVRHFYGEGGDAQTLEKKVAATYQKTNGDIRAMVTTLLTAPELHDAPPMIKRPLDFLVSALRETNAKTNAAPALQRHLSAMGQGLYEWPMPDGYPDRTAAWMGSLLARWNFALALAFNTIEGTRVESTRSRDDLALYLASPEFQWR